MTEVILSPPPPASRAVKTLGRETLILLSAASFICKAWRLAQRPFLNPGQPLGQLPCTASSQGNNNLGRGRAWCITLLQLTPWERCRENEENKCVCCLGILPSGTVGDYQLLPCPRKGFLWLGLGGCTAHVLAGKRWDSYGTSMLPPALPFLSPWLSSRATWPWNWQTDWFLPAL